MSSSIPSSTPGGTWQPPSVEEMQAMLPQYQFVALLGRGGMGAVYKAVQVSLEREVAIKVLPGDLLDDADVNFTERFKNEARTMAKMKHPGIVDVYDFGEADTGRALAPASVASGDSRRIEDSRVSETDEVNPPHPKLLYFVMEFIDGTDVSKMIIQQGRLPSEHALAITAHVCDALQYAHGRGVIHRDIKPANILIDMEGRVKVADFGLAKQSDPGVSGLTKTNMAMGTPDFVAPEALIAGIPLDGRADLYAVGVMLYNMLTGEIPRGLWMMPSLRFPGMDRRFDAIIARAMQTDREARYQSATEIRHDLNVILTVPMVKDEQKVQQATAAPAASPQSAAQSRRPGVAQPARPAKAPKAGRPGATPGLRTSQPPAKSKTPLLIGIAAVVIIGGGLVFMMNGKKPAETEGAAGNSDANASGATSAPSRPAEVAAPSTTNAPSSSVADFAKQVAAAATPEQQIELVTARLKEINGCDFVTDYKDGTKIDQGKVTGLCLRGTKGTLADLSPIAALKDLASLKLFFLRPGDLGVLRGLQLSFFWAGDCRSTDLSVFRGMPLRYFNFNVDPQSQAGDVDLSPLAGAPLEQFIVFGDLPSIEVLKSLPLKGVNINGNKRITSLEPLRGKALSELRVQGTGITDLALLRDMPLKMLYVDDAIARTPANRAIIEGIGSLTQINEKPVAEFWKALDAASAAAAMPVVAGGGPGAGTLTFGGHRYQAVSDPGAWSAAKAKAEAMGGHLVVITSKEENDWIRATFIDQLDGGKMLWLGATNSGPDGKWKWVTGDDIGFTDWVPMMTASHLTIPNAGAGFIRADSADKLAGWTHWNAHDPIHGTPDGRNRGFIVEWDDSAPAAKPADATLASTPAASTTGPITWTDSSGRTLTATFKGIEGDQVVLEVLGKPQRLLLSNLSAASQQQARALASASSTASTSATKDAPFVNSLGMKFVPVPGTKASFSVWLTRVQDYAAYAAANPQVDSSWKTQDKEGVPIGREADHPVVAVSWDDAQAFCAWLTAKEQAEGKLPKDMKYRLPSDEEWSTAVGLPAEQGTTPEAKHGKNSVDFPWGNAWPPPAKAGNYADETFHAKFPKPDSKNPRFTNPWIAGYTDGYATTSPVGSFAANAHGLHDMGGNVWQWSEDAWNAASQDRVLRGNSFPETRRERMLSSARHHTPPGVRYNNHGFRCVLAGSSAGAVASSAPATVTTPSQTAPIGTRDLFNGRDYTGWTGPGGAAAADSWRVDGSTFSATQRTTLWSQEAFGDCEIELEWKIGPRTAGGVFFLVNGTSELGAPEMQLVDPVVAGGGGGSGSLYRLVPEKREASKPPGEWNSAKVVLSGTKREHWINGEMVCSWDASQFRDKPGFAATSGKIVLQANDNTVAYRNVRVRLPGSGGAPAATSPTPPPMPAALTSNSALPTPNSSDPRLAQLDAAFKTEYAAKAQQTYEASVAALNTSYVGALGRARTAAQTKGVLAEVTAFDDELKRIQNNEGVPAADEASAPAALTTLRKTYRDTIAKHTATRAAAAAPVYDAYLRTLDAYIADLTRADKLEDAKRVKAVRDEIAKQKAEAK